MTQMISSNDVNGTEVLSDNSRESVGTIHHLVIDKVSGVIAYADMTFGGFLGIGEDHFQIPWGALRFDPKHGGYVTAITQGQLEAAPRGEDRHLVDRDRETELHKLYGTPVYWGASSGADTTAGAYSNRVLDPKRTPPHN